MRFFDRTDELKALQERWNSRRAEFLPIYGRRRVGKSHLIAHFASERRHLLFEATAGTERDHLDDLGREIARVSGRRIYEEQPLSSWRAAFVAFEELLEDGPILIAIDEFQFAARRNAEIGSLINNLMRDHKDDPRLRLVIAGSDVSFFEKGVVGYAATSYGRRTGSLHIEPFKSSDIAPFLPGWSIEDQIRAWAVFGGIPYYLDEIDPGQDLAENIYRAILAPDALLRSEPEFLLAQESRIRDRAIYMSALRAIATGATRLGEIAGRIGRRPEEARTFLETLEEMRLVRRRYPIAQESRQKVFYAITDPFLRFWFRFVASYESRLQTRESARRHLEETVAPELDHFVSRDAFEEVCQQWLLRQLPEAVEAGRWWGSRRERENADLRTRQYEADVVAVDASGSILGLGSCKWSRDRHPAEELTKLETIAHMLEVPSASFYFFDRTGFSERLRRRAADRDDIHLITVRDLEDAPAP